MLNASAPDAAEQRAVDDSQEQTIDTWEYRLIGLRFELRYHHVVELGEDVAAFESQVDAAIAGSSSNPSMWGHRSHDNLGFNSPESLEKFRATLMLWRQGSIDTPQSSATFTDATLIYTAHAVTRGGMFSPFALLDLATLVRSIVLYDHVFYIANPAIDAYALNERVGARVLIPIPRSNLGLGFGILCRDAIEELKDLSHQSDRQALNDIASAARVWEALLGRPCPRELMFHDVDRMWMSDLSPVHLYYRKWAKMSPPRAKWETVRPTDVTSVASAVTDANARSLVNMRAASLLEMPHTSSAFRAPFRRIRTSQALVAEEKLGLVEVVARSVRQRADVGNPTLEIPVFLAAVLGRIERLEQFWPAVGQVRAEASALRRRRKELEEVLEDDGSTAQARVEKQLSKAVTREAQTLASQLRVPVAGAAAAFVAAAVSGPAAAALAAIGALSLWEKMDSSTYDLLVARFRRPHEIFLSHIGEEAAAMHRGLPRIARIWQVPESSLAEHAVLLKRIAGMGLG